MNGATDIKLPFMLIGFLTLAIPITLSLIYKINITREIAVSVARMTVQLALVGIVLQYLFKWNYLWLTSIWFIFMIGVADFNILKKTKIKIKKMPFFIFISITISVTSILAFLIIVVIRPTPLYDAKHLIPLGGMILGNSMNGISLALERFYSALTKNKKEYYSYISMGANSDEGSARFCKEAYRAALIPTISNMATLGLVSLPGMMTGQILGGSEPTVAIKYQIIIMIAIFSSTSISALLSLKFLKRAIIDKNDLIIDKI
ncbi:MAG TPA: iron export ABC transporter permease subunit FetB [Spirochaetota bacterium]|nr:iron export ABC transporter permease subunit FetB [Spirochaetota bacterium]HOS32244.1 iron export ABC transporter permease subunit FetB [Spirochaetota bacterium]HOS55112.1 iron export ABC transporter permease subunit FetB [Spirochaetota bacterium]HPK62138.1 iron export ABC transporter permease subunit FetB [Spirochaetota bacterium]HQF77619.1 iron export ABC transporter permease subunit FetB [Spirochaetota bacterium]